MKFKIKQLVIIFFIGGIGLFVSRQFKSQKRNIPKTISPLQPKQKQTTVKPTPVPFADLTIPYLRNQNFTGSELQELERVEENEEYRSYLSSYQSEGLTINGLLTKPQGQTPEQGWPGIVFVHGYIPPQEYNTLDKYQEYVDYLASNGFVVYKIDLRGHGDSEGKPSSAYYGSDYVIDVLNAYKTLKKTDYVENVGLWGHSMGGNLVFRTMIVEQDIAATVVWAGAVFTYTDFADFQIEDNSYQRPDNQSERAQERRQLYEIHGRFDPQSSFWRKVIPTNYLEDVNTALQLHHAVNDQVVDIRYSRNIAAILNGSDIDVQFYEYQNGGHNITGGSFSSAMERTAVFFKEKLK